MLKEPKDHILLCSNLSDRWAGPSQKYVRGWVLGVAQKFTHTFFDPSPKFYRRLKRAIFGLNFQPRSTFVCCNLLIAWLWMQPVIVLPGVACACDDQSTVHLDWQLGGYSSAHVHCVWGINSFLLRISILCQFAGFHVANRAVIDVCYYCADVWSVLVHFGNEYSHARPSTGRSGQVINSVCMSHFSWCDRWPISCLCSTVAVAVPARLRLVTHCALVHNSLQNKLSAVSYDPLSHSRHNAGDRSTKVGHAINSTSQFPEPDFRLPACHSSLTAPPSLCRKAASDKMLQIIEAHPNWPVYADVFEHPPPRLASWCPVWSDMTSVDTTAQWREDC